MLNLSAIKKQTGKKSVAVFGLGLSGLSSIRALVAADIKVVAWDDKEESRDKAKALGAEIEDLTQIDLSGFAFLLLAPGVPYVFEPHPVVENAQKYDLEIIGDLELLHRMGHGIHTIGITGTNGKSTTTSLITHVLNACGRKAVMAGNIGVPVCDLYFDGDEQFLVLEMSSYQLDLCPTFSPDTSIVLNITPDHLDRHGSMKNYVEAKGKILKGNGRAIISVDDDFTNKLFDDAFCSGQRLMTPVSVRMPIPEGVHVSDGQLFENSRGENQYLADLSNLPTLKGRHNHQNIACSYAALKPLNIDLNDCINALESFSGLAHRQYVAGKINGVTFVNDSKATNAEAAAKALAAYDNILWIVGGRAKEGGLDSLEIFKDKILRTYVIGEAALEFGVWLAKHGFEHRQCGTLDKAVDMGFSDVKELGVDQATILLSPACASWDQFKSFEARGDAFMEQVRKLQEQVKEKAA